MAKKQNSDLDITIARIKKQNEDIKMRYLEVEADKQTAAKEHALVSNGPPSSEDLMPAERDAMYNKFDSSKYDNRSEPSRFNNANKSGGEGSKTVNNNVEDSNRPITNDNKYRTKARNNLKQPDNENFNRKPPPPDPYNFLADEERDGPKADSQRVFSKTREFTNKSWESNDLRNKSWESNDLRNKSSNDNRGTNRQQQWREWDRDKYVLSDESERRTTTDRGGWRRDDNRRQYRRQEGGREEDWDANGKMERGTEGSREDWGRRGTTDDRGRLGNRDDGSRQGSREDWGRRGTTDDRGRLGNRDDGFRQGKKEWGRGDRREANWEHHKKDDGNSRQKCKEEIKTDNSDKLNKSVHSNTFSSNYNSDKNVSLKVAVSSEGRQVRVDNNKVDNGDDDDDDDDDVEDWDKCTSKNSITVVPSRKVDVSPDGKVEVEVVCSNLEKVSFRRPAPDGPHVRKPRGVYGRLPPNMGTRTQVMKQQVPPPQPPQQQLDKVVDVNSLPGYVPSYAPYQQEQQYVLESDHCLEEQTMAGYRYIDHTSPAQYSSYRATVPQPPILSPDVTQYGTYRAHVSEHPDVTQYTTYRSPAPVPVLQHATVSPDLAQYTTYRPPVPLHSTVSPDLTQYSSYRAPVAVPAPQHSTVSPDVTQYSYRAPVAVPAPQHSTVSPDVTQYSSYRAPVAVPAPQHSTVSPDVTQYSSYRAPVAVPASQHPIVSPDVTQYSSYRAPVAVSTPQHPTVSPEVTQYSSYRLPGPPVPQYPTASPDVTQYSTYRPPGRVPVPQHPTASPDVTHYPSYRPPTSASVPQTHTVSDVTQYTNYQSAVHHSPDVTQYTTYSPVPQPPLSPDVTQYTTYRQQPTSVSPDVSQFNTYDPSVSQPVTQDTRQYSSYPSVSNTCYQELVVDEAYVHIQNIDFTVPPPNFVVKQFSAQERIEKVRKEVGEVRKPRAITGNHERKSENKEDGEVVDKNEEVAKTKDEEDVVEGGEDDGSWEDVSETEEVAVFRVVDVREVDKRLAQEKEEKLKKKNEKVVVEDES